MKYGLIIVLALAVTACDQEPPEKTVWDEQLKTMDKVRDVEKLMLDASEQQKQAIEESTNQ